jgi:hypothetical protein
MKKFTWLFSMVIMASLLLTGCKKEDDDINKDVEPLVLDCNAITSNMTLVDRGSTPDYIIRCRIQVEAVLTLDPGVEIAFGSDAGLEFNSKGVLNAQGTAVKPIILRGEVATPGHWRGIRFTGSNNQNKMHFTTVDGAGSLSWDGASIKSNISLSGNSKVEIKNSTISNSAGDGIHAAWLNNNPDAFFGFEGNTLTGNKHFPLRLSVAQVKDLGLNSFPANGDNKIEVHTANHNSGIIGNHTWTYPGAPILINSKMDIAVGAQVARLIIEEGVIIEMGSDQSISVNSEGALTINGTQAKPVIIRGEQTVKDFWKGIYILSNSANNVFTYTMISDGGSSSHSGYAGKDVVRVGTTFSGPYRLVMNDCTVSNSFQCGVRVSSNPSVGNFTDNNTTFVDLGSNVCDF